MQPPNKVSKRTTETRQVQIHTSVKCMYIESQKTVTHLIETQHRESIKQTADKLIREGGANSNTFLKTRKRIMNHNNHDDYDTIDENGNLIKDFDYVENLYQDREGEESYEQWTNHINDTVNSISKSNEQSQNENPISREELNTCITKLKRNKSNGPDRLPNEVFIEADEHTKGIYLEILNTIYREEQIPQQWQHGEIKRLYKGTGTNGKCSNERGITLASNAGKLFERLLNNRIKV